MEDSCRHAAATDAMDDTAADAPGDAGSARRDDCPGRGEAVRAAMTFPGEEAVSGKETARTATTTPSAERQRTAQGPCP